MYELFPETPPIMIGDISAPGGGHLKRHKSHQGGRDVGCRVLLQGGKTPWFLPATPANFDLARNWALVRALVTRTDVEMILLDTRVQRMLYKYALGLGEDKDFLDHVFQCGRGLRDAIVQHVVGHRTHYHVRFYNAVAQELGRRAHPLLVELEPHEAGGLHGVARRPPGQTLGQTGRPVWHVGAGHPAGQRRCGRRRLTAGRAYQIPMRGSAAPASEPLVVPHRRPARRPRPASLAAVEWPTIDTLYGAAGQ